MKLKNNLIFIFILFVAITLTGNVQAITYGRVTYKTGITKSGPGKNYSSGPTLKYNDVVPLWDSVPIKNSGCNAGWVFADVNGKNLYI